MKRNIIRFTLLFCIYFISNLTLAENKKLTGTTWISASNSVSNPTAPQPNAFYAWSGNIRDTWQCWVGSYTRTVSFGKDDKNQDLWVITTSSGGIQYSTDAATWQNATITGRYAMPCDAAFGYDINKRGVWVAVGAGTILYSFDGRTWQYANYNGRPIFQAVSYGNHKWIAVGQDGAIHTSVDGINWEDHSFQERYNFSSIGFGMQEGKLTWIVDGGSNAHFSSQDGVNWNRETDSLFDFFQWYSIKYANGLWAAAGPGIITSKDGKHWKLEPIGKGNRTAGMPGVGHGKDSEGNGIWVAFDDDIYILKDGTTNWVPMHYQGTKMEESYTIISSNELPQN